MRILLVPAVLAASLLVACERHSEPSVKFDPKLDGVTGNVTAARVDTSILEDQAKLYAKASAPAPASTPPATPATTSAPSVLDVPATPVTPAPAPSAPPSDVPPPSSNDVPPPSPN